MTFRNTDNQSSANFWNINVKKEFTLLVFQVGNHIDVLTRKWTALDSGIGGGIDSYLEYLVKGSLLLGNHDLMAMFRGETHSTVL